MHGSTLELYRVFENYRLTDDFCGTSFGISHSDYRMLTSKPLRELQLQDVECYLAQAMTTWGNVRHFKHFLPRLMELVTDHFLVLDQRDLLFGKLKLARWRAWSEPERNAVQRSLMHFWECQLAAPGDFPVDERIESALQGLHTANETVRPYLDRWIKTDDEVAALHLGQIARLVLDASAGGKEDAGQSGRLSAAVIDEVSAWLATRSVSEYLHRFQSVTDRFFPYISERLVADQTHRFDRAATPPLNTGPTPSRSVDSHAR